MGCNTIIYFVLCFWATELNWDASYLNQSPIQCWTRSIYMACMCQNLVNTCFNLIITLQCYIRILYVLQNLKNKVKSSQDSNVGLLTYGKMCSYTGATGALVLVAVVMASIASILVCGHEYLSTHYVK